MNTFSPYPRRRTCAYFVWMRFSKVQKTQRKTHVNNLVQYDIHHYKRSNHKMYSRKGEGGKIMQQKLKKRMGEEFAKSSAGNLDTLTHIPIQYIVHVQSPTCDVHELLGIQSFRDTSASRLRFLLPDFIAPIFSGTTQNKQTYQIVLKSIYSCVLESIM